MPLQETSGSASYDAFGGGAAERVFIEDVFSTYLYTGNGSTQTITNGIDLSTKGGLVWMKGRSGATDHALYDTTRGATKDLVSNSTAAETTQSTGLTAFNTTGFSIGALAKLNTNAATYASWTFRKQPKFFDVVTYTGDGSASPRQIAHSLGSVPGFIVIKRTDTTSDWTVWHRSVTGNAFLQTNDAWLAGFTRITTPDSTTFTVGASTMVNASGGTYVAYLFAHNAGGFGLSGSDNVISCGSYTGNGSANGPVVTLGYEPQWLLVKNSTGTGDWNLIDNMRGFVVGGADAELNPNLSNAESTGTFVSPTATGFQINTTDAGYNTSSSTYIYIAIRRGPMKVPTSGTSVFSPKGLVTLTSGQTVTTGFVTDMTMAKFNGTQEWLLSDRLRNAVLYPNTTDSEGALYGTAGPRPFDVQDGFKSSGVSGSYALWGFRRAPGFMDVVCYTGTGGVQNVTHNLSAVPQLVIVKARNNIDSWAVLFTVGATKYKATLNSDAAGSTSLSPEWSSGTLTSTTFEVGTPLSSSGWTYVAYLFATVAGVSKVGSYTGTGTTNQINCGFTTGARFVLIKRVNTLGNWNLYDSGQGIVAGNDPYFLVNTTDGQYTGTDYVDTFSSGFELSNTAPADLNANGGTYIFLAIA